MREITELLTGCTVGLLQHTAHLLMASAHISEASEATVRPQVHTVRTTTKHLSHLLLVKPALCRLLGAGETTQWASILLLNFGGRQQIS